MKTQEQILALIETYRPVITADYGAAIQSTVDLFDMIHSHIFSRYGSTTPAFSTITAAMLVDVIAQCEGLDNENLETAVIKMLTMFDVYYDILFKYDNSNGNIALSAAILMRKISASACTYYTELNNGNPYIIFADDTFEIEMNSSNNLMGTGSNDTYINLPDGINTIGLTPVIITPPTHGTAVVDGTGFQYTPDADYYGPDTFTYGYELDGNPVTTNVPFGTVNIMVALAGMMVYFANPVQATIVSKGGGDYVINVKDSDYRDNVPEGWYIEIVAQPEAGKGTVTIDENNDIVFTVGESIEYFTFFEYRYMLGGYPIPLDSETGKFMRFAYVDFINPIMNLCTEDVQGRITYTLQKATVTYPTIYTIDNFTLVSAELIVPTATPSSVIDLSPGTNLITPTGDMRAEIANGANTGNQFKISASYEIFGVPYTGDFVCSLPHFQLTDNDCVYEIPATFTPTTL